MSLMKYTFQILVVAFFAAPNSAYADSWSCRHDNLVREVHVERTSLAPVPCNVVYKKLTEGFEGQILWSAENDELYCAEKAKQLVAKLESSGWVCVETISDDGDNSEIGTGIEGIEESDEGDIATNPDA